MSLDSRVSEWFKENREAYKWPPNSDRKQSEALVNEICAKTQRALERRDVGDLRSALVDIHRWKTANQGGQSDKYDEILGSRGEEYLFDLHQLGPFSDSDNLREVIGQLKVEHCNLPVCSAIASFLFGRKEIPVVDKFLSQFFSGKMNLACLDEGTTAVLHHIRKIDFGIQKGSPGKYRLDVYTPGGYQHNLDLYLNDFIPECKRIAKGLQESKVKYLDIYQNPTDFSPIDVEMAIFAWASVNRDRFENL